MSVCFLSLILWLADGENQHATTDAVAAAPAAAGAHATDDATTNTDAEGGLRHGHQRPAEAFVARVW